MIFHWANVTDRRLLNTSPVTLKVHYQCSGNEQRLVDCDLTPVSSDACSVQVDNSIYNCSSGLPYSYFIASNIIHLDINILPSTSASFVLIPSIISQMQTQSIITGWVGGLSIGVFISILLAAGILGLMLALLRKKKLSR